MATPQSAIDSIQPRSAVLSADFALLWNASVSYQEAVTAIHGALGLAVGEIRTTAAVLHRAGVISPLPVHDDGAQLSEEDVLRFSLCWNRSVTIKQAAQAIGLPLDATARRARLLRDLGILLTPLKDFNFAQPGLVSESKLEDLSVDKVNDLLNGELIVRNALLRQSSLRRKAAALTASTLRMKQAQQRTDEQETFVSLAESFLRELGVF